ncbi:MAG: hypothetical protein A2958_01740 [Candidatus Levybacteria bacterium RIFCSPLOWO2_01_FULL_38_13]|nr:MAG: hypothetical protein A2629_01330 [Candidatus Levybacteria bacterium RIFCSPHIGHO2_01_FULL_41_15]OGH34666.1 MAG: hypothetical protein A2958_01740 [Candidatus Levybacteria bacterium RIFCSPLOWO2_01_FULL_38_13]
MPNRKLEGGRSLPTFDIPVNVHLSQRLSLGEKDTYLKAYRYFITGLDLVRFTLMSLRPLACFEAVDLWRRFEPVYAPLKFGDVWVQFDRKVTDSYGFKQTGQNVLGIKDPKSEGLMAIDVAAYLFGFSHDELPVAIGDVRFVEGAFTEMYGTKYPSIQVSVGHIEDKLRD